MIRTALLPFFMIIVLAGPLVAIAATSASQASAGRQSKSMCYFAGIACSKGPTLLPALSRLK